MRPNPGSCNVLVRREEIFADAFHEMMKMSPPDLKKRLNIKFSGEDGLDYGGLSRYKLLKKGFVFRPVYLHSPVVHSILTFFIFSVPFSFLKCSFPA